MKHLLNLNFYIFHIVCFYLILIKKEEFFIGNPNSYHKKQLDEYENALKKMGYSTLKKLLVYIETEVVSVTV